MNDYEIKQPPRDDHPVYQLNNGGIDSIMTTMPGWIVRWGTVVLCGLFAAFLVMANFIHFGDRTLLGRIFRQDHTITKNK